MGTVNKSAPLNRERVGKGEQPCGLFSARELRELVASYGTARMYVTNEEPDNKGAETLDVFVVSRVSM